MTWGRADDGRKRARGKSLLDIPNIVRFSVDVALSRQTEHADGFTTRRPTDGPDRAAGRAAGTQGSAVRSGRVILRVCVLESIGTIKDVY